jgi:Ca-activated chloride channel family protein
MAFVSICFSSIILLILTPLKGSLVPQERTTLQLRSDLVLVPVEVTNKKSGLPVGGLKKEDFVLFEDGVPQKITFLDRDNLPLSILLLVELNHIKDAARSVRVALQRLKPEDEVALMIFNGEPRLIQGFTRDKDLVIRSLEEVEDHGAPAKHLHLAVYEAANYMLEATDRMRRRVLIVITYNIAEPGSREEIKESERRVLERLYTTDIVVSGIIVGYRGPRLFHLHPMVKFARIDKFVNATGGRMGSAMPGKPVKVNKVVELIDCLRAQYILGYVPATAVRDGKFRKIKVELSSSAKKKYKDVQLRYRQGYIAAAGKEGESK